MRIIWLCSVFLFSVSLACAGGSSALLQSCFPAGNLGWSGHDTRISAYHAPDDSPPVNKTPHVKLLPVDGAYRKDIRRVEPYNKMKVAALTFDLCELATKTAGYDYSVVKDLRKLHAHATFFAGGKWMRSHPVQAKELMADPLFEVGNHAWTHGNFGVMDIKNMRRQIEWTQAEYETLRGELMASKCALAVPDTERAKVPQAPVLFRLPYGRCTPDALKLLNGYGLKVIQWDISDYRLRKRHPAEMYAERLFRHVRPGSIVLMHANGVVHQTAEVAKLLAEKLKAAGYRLVTVSELLETGRPYAVDQCYFEKPGDNLPLDKIYGDGTRHPHR